MKAIISGICNGLICSKRPLFTYEILGKPIINYLIESLKNAGVEEVFLLTNSDFSSVIDSSVLKQINMNEIKTLKDFASKFLNFDEPNDVLVINGLLPLIKVKALKELIEIHNKNISKVSVFTTYNQEPKKNFINVVEQLNASKNVEYGSYEIDNMIKEFLDVFIIKPKILKDFMNSEALNSKLLAEFNFGSIVESLEMRGLIPQTLLTGDDGMFKSVENFLQFSEVSKTIRICINNFYMENGVMLVNPEHTYISSGVTIGEGTIIYPGTYIEGNSEIGNSCVIGPDTSMKNMVIADDVEIKNSVAIDSKIGKGTKVGPFAYIRPNSCIGEDCKVGDFVEVKNSNIGNGTKASHLTYVGDSDLGNNINLGCGTVTVNFDGKNKFRTVIEDDVFIGCNANLVAPVKVEKGAFVAAGSTITDDVPTDTLAIARSRQLNKSGWKKPSVLK